MIKRKRKTTKLTAAKVQVEFNAMIRRRDNRCMVNEGSCNNTTFQASHYFPVGGNGGLRFYPYNCFCQCAKHHNMHHHGNTDMYPEWMRTHCPEELEWMKSVCGRPVRYTQEVLREILAACKDDDCEKVRRIVRGLYVAESR
jgi:hypothetical protein